jgi:hypothetical protein
MRGRISLGLGVALAVAAGGVLTAAAVSGAAFTTFNAHVDGASRDVCKNSAINCNIYGAKEYVWLNGGPTANGLGPDGQYFFAVLEPGGQPNPNDRGGVPDKNLSDDYDLYTNRTFTVAGGEVAEYDGTHWLDSGRNEPGAGDPTPNGMPPYIRLYPYSDTTNPGGVYIMAICSLEDGYPVEPRDCKYDAFKVKKGKVPYSFMLSGTKFQDTYADGIEDAAALDPGLPGVTISITGTGPDGLPIHATAVTDSAGYWEWMSAEYAFNGGAQPQAMHLEVCESVPAGWTQSAPDNGCYTLDSTPVAGTFESFPGLDFGNWEPAEVRACKVRDLDGALGGETVPVEGWSVSLYRDGAYVDTQSTGADGCYTWTGLTPGSVYEAREGARAGWLALGAVDHEFERARSGEPYEHTFVNAVLQGCTPGFWQGGNDFGTAGGQWLWNELNDPQWVASGGAGTNPYMWTSSFNGFFAPVGSLDGFDMMSLVGTGGGPDDYQKAARSLVAAYLNASWGMNYKYTTAELSAMWADAVAGGNFLQLHLVLDSANNADFRTDGGPHCPISASIP